MSEYKRLGGQDVLKLKNYKKVKKLTGKSLKWTLICSGIFLAFVAGVFAFYKFVDNNYKNNEEGKTEDTNLETKVDSEDTSDLDELSKNELERETKKAEKLESDSKEKDTKNDNESTTFKKSYDLIDEFNKMQNVSGLEDDILTMYKDKIYSYMQEYFEFCKKVSV